ncbi:MFS transporter [Actinomadura macrotermitis]|uniref:Major facilitator superfamily (MFS) profile domain-containing protein n=1 Tax=Actinomadura macrotermitis TaxID=2585200 RepID=A0A7K0BLU3_9ACTN|nr:MFS transporter [Actinomadura macrotermitis]MQY02121.1 hypothetical protein [Actinomadura macrotermitis]
MRAVIARAGEPAPGVLRNADFRFLWAGQTVSLIGSQVSLIALPLLAVMTLGAGPFQVGVLAALGRLPWLLFGLPAGAWADRSRRRPLLIGADLVRAAALAWIPAASVLGVLTLGQVYAVALVAGTMTVLFEVAAPSLLPSLVAPERLVDGNSRLEMSRAGAEAVGPGLGGVVVQAVTAPLAIIVDVVSFLASAVLLARIGTRETRGDDRAGRGSFRTEIREGLRFVLRHPLLRWNVFVAALANLFGSALLAILVLYVLTGLGLRPALIGLVLGLGSLGGVLGAAVATRLFRRIGLGPTLAVGLSATAAGALLLAAVTGPYPLRVLWAVAAVMLTVFGVPVFDVAVVTLRQLTTPDRLLGRVNATMRFLVFGTMPAGALAGGALAEEAGLRTTVLAAGIGLATPVLLVLVSPLARLKAQSITTLGDTP